MWLTFWQESLHLVLEFLCSLVAFAAAWLFLDAWLMKREGRVLLRALGFLALAAYGVSHAIGVSGEAGVLLTDLIYLIGLAFILVSLLLDVPPRIPTLSAVIVFPPASQLTPAFNGISTAMLGLVTLVAGRRYLQETTKSLGPLAVGFGCLAVASGVSWGATGAPLGRLWALEHVLRLAGFAALSAWVWQYLRFRVREELLLVQVTIALASAVLVAVAVSGLLLTAVEREAERNVSSEGKVLEYAVRQLHKEALSDVRLLSSDEALIEALAHGRRAELSSRANRAMRTLGSGFLIVADSRGDVLARGRGEVEAGDSVSGEEAAGSALEGRPALAVEATPTEGLSIRAAAPMYAGNRLVGVVVSGYKMDLSLAWRMKSATGLDSAIYQRSDGAFVEVAGTMVGPDGKSRGIGTRFTDPAVIRSVLGEGEGYVGRTELLERPYLASYVPVIGADGRVVGMMSVMRAQESLIGATKPLRRLALLTSVVAMLALTLPAYWMARHAGGRPSP